MNAVDLRARFWDGPAVPGRAIELSVRGALVHLPWTASFSESDAMVAYAARASLQLSAGLTVPCAVDWVSGSQDGLEFGVEFGEVDPADVAALAMLVASVSADARTAARRAASPVRRRYLRVPHEAPARLRRFRAPGGTAPLRASAGDWRTARVLDLSAGGCRLRTRDRLRPGETVEIDAAWSPGIPVMATVRWSRRIAFRATAGVEFAVGDARRGTSSSAGCAEEEAVRDPAHGERPVSAPTGVSTALLAHALETVSEGSLITDAERRTIFANSAFTTITGYAADEIIGSDCRLLQGADTAPETVQRIRTALRAKQVFQGEILNYRKDGTAFWNHLTITPITDGDGSVTHFVSVQRDVTRQVEERRRLTFDAEHDGLTGLLNRAGLRRHLANALLIAEERSAAVAVVLLDLDRFKAVNDEHGHPDGDQVLIAVAERLTSSLRPGDHVARLGGDEFVIVLDDLEQTTASSQVDRALERLQTAVAERVELTDASIRIRVSAGVALFPAHGTDAGALLRQSDGALYRAKRRSAGEERWWVVAGDR